MGIRAVFVIALVLAAFAVPAAHAAGPGDFVGIYSEDAFYRAADYRDVTFRAQANAGIGLERFPFDWREIETAPGVYDFSRYDAFVGAASRAGLVVLPAVGDAPLFRADAPSSAPWSIWYPPRNPADLAQFMTVLIGRYGSLGSFWAAHPELPRLPITNWQIWNEPNLPMFWGMAPNAAAYARLLRVTGAAVHGADPAALVVSAGLPDSLSGIPLSAYLEELYAAGFKGTFDIFGLHGYAPGLMGTYDLTAFARDLLDEHGDGSPIWITEFGWATGGNSTWYSISEKQQAEQIGGTLSKLWNERARLKLRGVVVFKWRDAEPPPGLVDAWPLYAGMLRADGSAKPALAALTEAIGAMRVPDPPATVPNGPPAAAPVEAPTPQTTGAPAVPARVAKGDLIVRWVEVVGRRALLHVRCARSSRACSGRIRAWASKSRHGAREYRVSPGARVLLAVDLRKRLRLHRRWLTVYVSPTGTRAQKPQQLRIHRLG